MSQGRGSAYRAAVIMLTMLCFLARTEHVRAAIYTVGGPGGWTPNIANWPNGKSFKAGDVLVFNYDRTAHNVVSVDRGGYTSCRVPARAKVYSSGRDRITLRKGSNYFICSFPGHCESGMKIAVPAV